MLKRSVTTIYPEVHRKEYQPMRCNRNLFWFFFSFLKMRINKVREIFIKTSSIKFAINDSWSIQSKALERSV